MDNKKTPVFIYAGTYQEYIEINGEKQHIGKALASCIASGDHAENKKNDRFCETPVESEHRSEETLMFEALQLALKSFCKGKNYCVTFGMRGRGVNNVIMVMETGEAEEFAKNGKLVNANGEEYEPEPFLKESRDILESIFQYSADHKIKFHVSFSPLALPQYETAKQMVGNRISSLTGKQVTKRGRRPSNEQLR